MNKKQFFLGIILASLLGGVIALAGASYLTRPNSASNFTDKQNTSLVNWLSDDIDSDLTKQIGRTIEELDL